MVYGVFFFFTSNIPEHVTGKYQGFFQVFVQSHSGFAGSCLKITKEKANERMAKDPGRGVKPSSASYCVLLPDSQ